MDTNDETPFGKNTYGSLAKSNYKKPSAALTLLPSVQKQITAQELEEEEKQDVQQLNNNVRIENLEENDTLIDVIAATMTAAIKSNRRQTQDLTMTRMLTTAGGETIATFQHKLPTAEGWNSVSSRSKTNLET